MFDILFPIITAHKVIVCHLISGVTDLGGPPVETFTTISCLYWIVMWRSIPSDFI